MEIEDVRRLTLAPGDTLVLRVEDFLDRDEIDALKAQMDESFPGHQTLVLCGGCDLAVVSPPTDG